MADVIKAKALEFAKKWENRGYEKGESQSFWNTLLRDILGVERPEDFIEYEDQVLMDKSTGFIDGYIPSSKILIEQKSIDKDLKKAVRQSDGSLLTPFEQAKRYIVDLPVDRHPRWVITCNFKEFHIYDMNKPGGEPEIILLKDLPKEYYRLSFITDTENVHLKKEMELSLKAGEIVGEIYEAFKSEYKDMENPHSIESLNKLCVRLVFCLYAEDSGLFKFRSQFHDYLNGYSAREMRRAIIDLFKVLDTPENERAGLYMTEDALDFPYVNGGLFSEEDIEIPLITDKIRELLLAKASDDFDWSEISPTIFGAVFESTLNPETRRSGGMHYTSIENIHKVIDPLFLDALKKELEEIKTLKQRATIEKRAREYQEKLSSLVWLDPAAGSGNFLTESYICVRKLENEAIRLIFGEQMSLIDPVKVSIGQFYGLEINDFAVSVARTALWIAESQMKKATEDMFNINLEYLPLKSFPNIREANALRIDWNELVEAQNVDYIMGNPPFVGQSVRTKVQSEEMSLIWGKGENETKLDYVICWYKKAIDYLNSTSKKIEVAFVSTNSICQGESVPTFWKKMIDCGAEIQFAYKTFVWNSETSDKAIVHCVIIGFTNHTTDKEKLLFDDVLTLRGLHINPYLFMAPDIWITNRKNIPLNNSPKMTTGSPPTDGGGLTFTSTEKIKLIKNYPVLEKYIRPFIGAREFLHDKIGEYSRYCFWFKNGNPSDYAHISEIQERFAKVKAVRNKSNADRIKKMADYPYLFCQDRQPESTYLVFPRHSSQNRRYIPIGFKNPDIIAGDACSIIPNLEIYEFAVLTSNVHNAWLRVICGRIKSDFRYSPAVYNNFPWPDPTQEQKEKIEKTGQAILDARNIYPESSLADLYDDLIMPVELRKAHQENDKAVMSAYGFDWKTMTESECVAELMKMYQKLTD